MNRRKLERLTDRVADIYTGIETNMLINIAKLLRDNKDILENDPAKWKIQKLEDMGILTTENIKVIRDNAKLASREMNKVLLNAGLDELEVNERILEKAYKKGAHLIKPPPIQESPVMLSILYAYQRQAVNKFNLTNQTLIDQANMAYIDILDKTVANMLVGEMTGTQAIRSVINQWADNGIPALIDRGGKEWSTEAYTRMVAMTTSNNVTNDMQMARYEEWGNELVEISSHEGNRPGCEPYAGNIFSLKPNHPIYPYLYDPSIGDIGEPHSLFGINCGHVSYPYIEGISVQRYFPNDKEENAKVYEESQKQRALERSIRDAKKRELLSEALGDEEGAKQARELLSTRQARIREFIKETDRTRRYDREWIHKGGK